ncbi:integrator complex subunit 10 [Aplysia californica]|uniref:Integrator complex subunit 10 n=1 Tax=Aplysia californica TaxID=6500 RepID=A0ABM0K7G3_APLCA|nr:integrator complex subunit 10 [Aplysia californica]
MASAVNETELSDVDWLVMRARSFPKTDPYSAKAWLITAKSLFPQSFVIQFESYLVEKAAKNVDEAARHLQDMLQNFPTEPRLWSEVHDILESLQRESQDQRITFLTELFAAIPTSTQCLMLLRVSEGISNVLERCQLLLLAMRKFPNLVQEHGLKLVEMLVTEETNSGIVSNPVNCYRKLLVCDVMPLVLQKSGHLEVNMFHLYIWLQRAIEFYVSYVSQPNPSTDSSGETDANKGAPKPRGISGLPESDMQVPDPWGSLLKLLLLIGQRLNWDMERNLVMKSKQYQIQSLQHQLIRTGAAILESNSKQVLHTAMVLFVYALVNYVGYVDTESSTAVGSSHLVPIILLESLTTFKSETSAPSRAKKAKVDSGQTPVINPSPAVTAFPVIFQLFEMGIKCFELLNSSEEMKFEFFNLCQKWRKETQSMMSYFQTDMYIYQANYEEAIGQLQSLCHSAQGRLKTRVLLQLACCYFCMKKYTEASETVMGIIESIPSQGASAPAFSMEECVEEKPSANARVLVMLPCTDVEVLPFCLQLLITGLKEKMLSSQRTDTCLAHLIILVQYDWPKQEALFSEVISVIQKQGSFTYNTFFSYVHEVDILEEFAFLDTPEGGGGGGKVTLDIMPTSTKALAQQRTVTRGVNKGVKEDFKAALEKQVGHITESSDVVIRRFLKDERDEILKCLS